MHRAIEKNDLSMFTQMEVPALVEKQQRHQNQL